MSTMTFFSSDPTLHGLDVDHGLHGRAIEEIMSRPEFFDRNHRLHYRAVGDVRAHHEVLFGTQPMPSGSENGDSPTMSFNSGTGAPMVATGQGWADEHSGKA